MTRRLPALAAALILAAAAPARADALLDSVSTLVPSVASARVAGAWEEAGRKGVYRIVATHPGSASESGRLFIQWIATAADGSMDTEKTIEIKEIADQKLGVVDYTTEADADGLAVFIEATNPAEGGGSQTYELFIDGRDAYRFGPASN